MALTKQMAINFYECLFHGSTMIPRQLSITYITSMNRRRVETCATHNLGIVDRRRVECCGSMLNPSSIFTHNHNQRNNDVASLFVVESSQKNHLPFFSFFEQHLKF